MKLDQNPVVAQVAQKVAQPEPRHPVSQKPPHPDPRRSPSPSSPSSPPNGADQGQGQAPLPLGRRADTPRLNMGWPTSSSMDSPSADGMLFAQLIQPVGEQDGQGGGGFGSGGIALATQAPDELGAELVDELAQHLPSEANGPLEVTLLMPTLGRVQVRANQQDGQWNVDLGFTRRDMLRRLRPHEKRCTDALSAALGRKVDLSMHAEEALA